MEKGDPDGRRWMDVELPEEFGYSSWLSVRIAGPKDVWVKGDGSRFDGEQWVDRSEIRRWDGSTWHKVAVPTEPDGFAVVASDDVWVVGIIEQRAHHWDGSQWRAFDLPGASGCFDRLEAVAADDVWAFGRNPCDAARSSSWKAIAAHWDGTAWNEVALPKQAPFQEVAVAGPDDLWAASLGTILHWDGEAWNAVGGKDYDKYPPPGGSLLVRYDP